MDANLEMKLIKKYPLLFADINKSPQETCICWGVSTGNGWYDIIDEYCKAVYPVAEQTKDDEYKFKFMQVKEKYGTIRLYTTFTDNDGIVDTAESKAYNDSQITCEHCGTKEGVWQDNMGWIHTACQECRVKFGLPTEQYKETE